MPHIKLGFLAVAGVGFVATANFDKQGVTRWPAGYRTMTVAIPPEAPRGRVELASYGLAELTPDGGLPMTALHVRMTVANQRDDVPWSIDFTRTRLDIPGEHRIAPTFVNANIPTLPLAIVERGERVLADLYFALPPRIAAENDLRKFDVTWVVARDGRLLESRTRFEHARKGAPLEATPVPPLGASRAWWFDPAYPWSTYYHRPGRLVPRPPRHVTLTRARVAFAH